MLVVLSVLTGVIYPYLVTGIAQLAFPRAANGSLIEADGKAQGSTADRPAVRRSEVLLGPAVGDLAGALQRGRVERIQSGSARSGARRCGDAIASPLSDADPGNTAPVPVDLVTASGSGLDPHISSLPPPIRSLASPGTRHVRRYGTCAVDAGTRRAAVGLPRRAPRQRARTQSRAMPRNPVATVPIKPNMVTTVSRRMVCAWRRTLSVSRYSFMSATSLRTSS